MQSFFSGMGEVLTLLYNYASDAFTGLYSLISQIPKFLSFGTTLVSHLPQFLIPFCMISITLSIVLLILGRN